MRSWIIPVFLFAIVIVLLIIFRKNISSTIGLTSSMPGMTGLTASPTYCGMLDLKSDCTNHPECIWHGCVPKVAGQTYCQMLTDRHQCVNDSNCMWAGCGPK